MNLRTFSAPTFAQAMMLVKTELGPDAVILHTRTVQRRRWLGLTKRETVEITAGSALDIPVRSPRRSAANGGAAQQPQQPPQQGSGQSRRPSPPQQGGRNAAARPGQQPQPPQAGGNRAAAAPPGQELLDTPAGSRAMMLAMTSELRDLKGLVEGLVRQNRSQTAPNVPDYLFDHYCGLIENEVAEEVATDMIRQLQMHRQEQLGQPEFVRQRLVEQVERMIPAAGPIKRTKAHGPHIVALIGPTGVGKTTTLAKLAANLKLREDRKVGLITIDTYRIAAIDQLRRYAELIGSPLKIVNTPEDMRAAVAHLCDCDYILIDTAGRSPADAMKLNELKGFLDAANPDEVHLVLSSTASECCIELAIERFGQVRVDKIIFTKLDEAVHIGVVLNVIRKVNKALSYVTTGQNVPDDIEVGRGSRLAQMLLGKGGQPA